MKLTIEPARGGFLLHDESGVPPIVFTDGAELLSALAIMLNIGGVEIARVIEMQASEINKLWPPPAIDHDVPPESNREEPPPGRADNRPQA